MNWPSSRSTRTHLLLLVLVALLPASAILLHRSLQRQKESLQQAQRLAENTLQDLVDNFQHRVDGSRQFLQTLALLPQVQRMDLPACNALFLTYVQQDPRIASLLIVDPQGMVRAAAAPFTPFSVLDRPYIQKALSTRQFSAGELLVSRITQKQVFHFALPVLREGGELIGILAVGLDVKLLKPSLSLDTLPADAELCATDQHGRVLHAFGARPPRIGEQLDPEQFSVLGGKDLHGMFQAPGKDGPVQIAFHQLRLSEDAPPFAVFRLVLPEAQIFRDTRRAMNRDLLGLGLASVLAIGGALLLGNLLIAGPLNQLAQRNLALTQGDFTLTSPTHSGTREIRQLSEAFQDMAQTLGSRERQLRESEARIRDILDTISEAIFIHDPRTGTILEVSQRASDLYGYTLEDFPKLSIEAISSGNPPFTQQEAARWLELAQMEGPQLFPWEARHRDGHIFPVEVGMRATQLEGQDRVIVSVRETTDRIKAERALKVSEARFRLVAQQTRQAVYDYEPATGLMRWQGAVEALTGEESPGSGLSYVEWSERIHPDDRDAVINTLQLALAEERSYRSEYRFRHGEGHYLWIEDQGFCLRASETPTLRALGAMADITSRREIEQALQDKDELLNLFFAQSLDGFYLMALDEPLAWGPESEKEAQLDWVLDHLRIKRVNGAFAEQYGSTPSALIGRTIRTFYAHDEARGRAGLRHLLDQGQDRAITHERRDDGTEIWIEGDYLCIHDHEGRLVGHFGIQRDISSRMKADQDLRASEARFKAIFDHTFQFLGVLDPQGNLLQANKTSLEFVGLPSNAVIGRPFWETPWWTHEKGAQNQLRKAVQEAAQGRFVRFETSHTGKDGLLHTVDFSLKPVLDDEDQVIMLIAEGRDISDLKRSEEAFKERDQLFRLLFERSGDPNLLIDGNLFVDCNPATVALLGGRNRAQVLQTHPSDLSPETQPDGRLSREKADEMIAIAFERGSHRFEWMHRRLDGSTFLVDVRLTAIPWEGHWILHTAWRDLSDRERAEADRRSLESQLLQTQKLESLGVLAGGIAHDFNNLLTAILGNLNLAENHSEPTHPSRPYLETAERTVVKAAELTQQMLAYSGRGQFVVRRLDLSQQVQEMANLIQVSIPKKVSLDYHLCPGLPTIEVDVAQLQQVLLNLVTNAAEAIGNQEGSVAIITSLAEVEAAELQELFPREGLVPGSFVTLEVRDNGCGMSPGVLARIFDPFFTTKKSGRGLGLSAMLGILRGHGAGLRVSSTEGHGSSFKVFFPAKEGAAETAPMALATESHPTGGTLLVVDDEPTLRETCAEALQLWGYEVIEAADGQEAVDWVRTHPGTIALVLMDLTMPRMDGHEAFLEMRRMAPDLKVILSSGYSEQDSLRPLIESGLMGFLQKPYTLKELRRMVQEALNPAAP